MLEGVDSIDWASLSHCSELATDIPSLLEELALSTDEHYSNNVFGDPYIVIMEIIGHQQSVNESAIYVVPFFIQLLDVSQFQRKALLLSELAYLCRAIPDDAEFDPDTQQFIAGDYSKRWLPTLYAEIKKGIPIFRQLLEHEDTRIAMSAADLLTNLEGK